MLPAWGEESDTVESQLSKRSNLLKLPIPHLKMSDTMPASLVSTLAVEPSENRKGRLRRQLKPYCLCGLG